MEKDEENAHQLPIPPLSLGPIGLAMWDSIGKDNLWSAVHWRGRGKTECCLFAMAAGLGEL